jgi:hypothetical protein
MAIPPVKPFAKPWKLVDHDESFEIQDAAGVALAFIYYEDEPIRRGMMKRLSKYDARRMAHQIMRLPQLVRIAKGINPDDA